MLLEYFYADGKARPIGVVIVKFSNEMKFATFNIISYTLMSYYNTNYYLCCLQYIQSKPRVTYLSHAEKKINIYAC